MQITLPSPLHISLGGTVLAAVLLNIVAFGLAAVVPVFDLISSATPAVLVISLFTGLIALITRGKLIALAAFLGGVAPPAIAIGMELAATVRSSLPETATRIKVVSLNVWSANGQSAPVESFIASERPELLLLQEAARNDNPSLYEMLETIYPTVVANYPHCSTAIATTWTLVEHSPNEECASTIARLRLPETFGGGEIMVASVHFPNARHGAVGPDADILKARMSAWRHAIVGGDFNATPWSWGMRRFDAIVGFERWTRALSTWPTPMAFLPIDHVLSTRDWRPIRVRRGPNVGSDHYPVIVELGRPSGS